MAAPQNFSNNFETNHFIKLEIPDQKRDITNTKNSMEFQRTFNVHPMGFQ